MKRLHIQIPKAVRLVSTNYFVIKIPNKRELQQISIILSSDIGFKYFMRVHKNA